MNEALETKTLDVAKPWNVNDLFTLFMLSTIILLADKELRSVSMWCFQVRVSTKRNGYSTEDYPGASGGVQTEERQCTLSS